MPGVRKLILALLVLATAALAAGPAQAHGRGRIHFGVQFGAPFYGPPYYDPFFHPFGPHYYPPRVYVVPSPQPQIWIERESAEPATPVPGYWYYCPGARAYYPSVGSCPGGWQRVPPQPPPG
jgi:hypothetical protein